MRAWKRTFACDQVGHGGAGAGPAVGASIGTWLLVNEAASPEPATTVRDTSPCDLRMTAKLARVAANGCLRDPFVPPLQTK